LGGVAGMPAGGAALRRPEATSAGARNELALW
jgi:hypothetical protein